MYVFEDRKWNLREPGVAGVSLYAVQDLDRSRRKSVRWDGA